MDDASYLKKFEDGAPDEGKRLRALQFALDIRKFEIELYWKRAAYFWAFLALIFAGYFAILNAKDPPDRADPLLLVSCLGSVFSFAWYLVNRASKFWQENWESHVDLLEDIPVGPLYKTVLKSSEMRVSNWIGAFPFSVSKINQILSLFVVFVFVVLDATTLVRYFQFSVDIHSIDLFAMTMLAMTIGTVCCLWIKGKTEFPGVKRVRALTRATRIEHD